VESPQEYYQHHSPMTAPGKRAVEFSALPEDVEALCKIVQGVLIHQDMARWLYAVALSERQRDDAHITRPSYKPRHAHLDPLESKVRRAAADLGIRLPCGALLR
jgi:hypothetical protein